MKGNVIAFITIVLILLFTGGIAFGLITVPPQIEHPILFRGFMLCATLFLTFVLVMGTLPPGKAQSHRNFGIPPRDQD